MWGIGAVAELFFSFTRSIARLLIWGKFFQNFWDIVCWNSIFYCSIVAVAATTFYPHPSYASYSRYYLDILIWFCLVRINELALAFFNDALPNQPVLNIDGTSRRKLDIKPGRRIVLLALAYFEIIVEFGIIYYALQQNVAGGTRFGEHFGNIIDAVYFSVMTVTTTGFGDYHPTDTISRLATMYEAVVGIVLIVIALGGYVSEAKSKP